MAFVLDHNTLGANVYLIIFTEELGPLVRMLQTVLLSRLRLLLQLLFFLLGADVPLTVEVVQDGEVFDQLFDIWAEVTPARWTSQDVARAQVHQAVLAESVAASQNARDLLFVVVLIETDRTGDFHPVIIAC